jgi:hypothetical protein
MDKPRALLLAAMILAMAGWAVAIGGIAAGTAFACKSADAVKEMARLEWSDGGLSSVEGGGAGGGNGEVGLVWTAQDLLEGGLDGGAPATAPGSAPARDPSCGSGFGLQWWALSFHALVWALAARALLIGGTGGAAASASTAAASQTLAPLMAVAAAYATWCASLSLGGGGSGDAGGSSGPLKGIIALVDAMLLAALPGVRAATSAATAGWIVLAAADLTWLVLCHCCCVSGFGQQQMAAAGQGQQEGRAASSPPPPPSAVYIWGQVDARVQPASSRPPPPADQAVAKSEAAAAAERAAAAEAELAGMIGTISSDH